MTSGNTLSLEIPFEKLNSYTQIVHSIFGDSVGTCYGTFSCSCSRQQGRLYVASKALMFYSNLFGFERRLCMHRSEIIEIKIYRTTSIWVSMMDGEDFIFKSFSDRDKVLALNQLLMGTTTESSESNKESNDNLELSSEPMQETAEEVVNEPSEFLEEGNPEIINVEPTRTESSSKKNVVDQVPCENGINISSHLYRERRSSTGDLTEDLLDAWKKEKESKRKHEEIIVGGMLLNCSLGDFFDLFLSDDAIHSIANFQEKEIGDTEVEVTKWSIDDSHLSTMTRVISFRHPISNTFGIGPSTTIAIRKQVLHRHGTFGICVHSTTNIKGVPASDLFSVHERWLIEPSADDKNKICLTVLNEIYFSKRSFLKKMITSTTKEEVRKWYQLYVAMLTSRVKGIDTGQQKSMKLPESNHDSVPPINKAPDAKSLWCLITIFLILAVALQNYLLRKQVHEVEQQILTIQQQQFAILTHLKDIHGLLLLPKEI